MESFYSYILSKIIDILLIIEEVVQEIACEIIYVVTNTDIYIVNNA